MTRQEIEKACFEDNYFLGEEREHLIEFTIAMVRLAKDEDAKIVEGFSWGALSNVAKAIRECKP